MRTKIVCVATTLGLSFTALAGNGIGQEEQEEQWVFENGMNNPAANVPNYACYRIPAIVKLNNGELLAFAEGREHSCSDHDENIDIVMRKRDQSGQWGPVKIVADHGGKVTRNPAPVVDESGNVHLVYNVNYDSQNPDSEDAVSESSINQNNNRYRASVYYIRSSDNGESWAAFASQPANLDATVHPYAANSSYENGLWAWYAMTPGHALRLDNGKLFFPANHAEYKHGLPDGEYRYYSHAITLDPTTDTFSLNDIVGPDTNEVMAEQLDNGWIYMNMRNNHRSIGAYRAVTYSKDYGENWMGTEYDHIPEEGSSNYWRNIGYDPTLITPRVQSSVLRFSSDKGETGVSRLLFSNPADTSSRVKGTIRVSYDEGKTWSHSYRYNSSESQYSDLVKTNGNTVGILYEEGNSGHNGIYYIEANLEKITGSKDAYVPTVVREHYADGRSPNDGLIADEDQTGLDPQTGDLTVSVTFTLAESANTQDTQFLARKGNPLSQDAGWGLFIEDGKLKFRAADAVNRYGVQATLSENLKETKHTITAKFDRSPSNGNEQMSLYLDGVKLTATPLYDSLTSSVDIQSSSPLIIAGSDHHNILNGLVYSYQVYEHGLDSQTIEKYSLSNLKDYNFSDFFDNPENNNFEDFFSE
ncbi:sialidase family protein [Vibrio coralliilyticus]|uniref:sialidase family protein n=1 Tax=Vibrio coralliilyticus TaxID=190893 RepID=UPI000C1657E8|nr:sialidase family protein [Vibrio coralliilyticus]